MVRYSRRWARGRWKGMPQMPSMAGLWLGADAEAEAAGGDLVDGHGGLGHGEGVAGEGGDDAGAEVDAGGAGGGGGEDGEGVGGGTADGEPGDVEAGGVGGGDAVDEGGGVGGDDVDANLEVLHGWGLRCMARPPLSLGSAEHGPLCRARGRGAALG